MRRIPSSAACNGSRAERFSPTHEHREFQRLSSAARTCSSVRLTSSPYVAGQLRASGQAILRGDVVPLPAPLTGGSMTSLYAGLPVYFDDNFFSVTVENGSEVAIVWLIPITAEETAFIRDQGWEAFEDALVRQDPDLARRCGQWSLAEPTGPSPDPGNGHRYSCHNGT
ncbi:suppressor of fused domain protein [Streptomyces sp. TLI_053]|uniref:suppressor of fused domain protein n=1 Tax=Streptomyces sp. TLI_053 TaxID=1855352 RepID=UPI000B85BE54|nr:suppressor of fused domain protein [Streptomyces sp. TLI_053]